MVNPINGFQLFWRQQKFANYLVEIENFNWKGGMGWLIECRKFVEMWMGNILRVVGKKGGESR